MFILGCLYRMPATVLKIDKPRHRKKVAMFDYDWTLVKPKTGGTFPKDVEDWMWLFPSIPETLRAYYEKGYAIVVFTNQSKAWKVQQIETVMSKVGIPCAVYVGMQKEEQKPATTIFTEFLGDKEWDTKKSFFVGDALGRAADFSDSDKVFAERIGVRAANIYAPEAFFEHEKPKTKSPPRVARASTQELVVMVGYPASGKSTITQTVFKPNGYEILESDELKTVAKIRSGLKKALVAGKSVVVDATNPTRDRRKEYIDIAKAISPNIQIRAIHVATTMEESVARNNLRPKEKGVPMIAYYTYRKRFEAPTVDEGFDRVEIA